MTMPDDQLVESRRVHESLSTSGIDLGIGDGILTRWVVIAEFMGDDGERHICRIHQESMTTWDARGFMHEGLRDWTEAEEE